MIIHKMKAESHSTAAEGIESLIFTVRGEKVILDDDLAAIYGVPTKRLNEQVRRNQDRFPADFMFQLTRDEAATVLRSRSGIATSKPEPARLRSQIATSKDGRGGRRYLPYAFTEQGVIMAANVLNSSQAVRMSASLLKGMMSLSLKRSRS